MTPTREPDARDMFAFLKESPIHGQGLFARAPIVPGTRIIEYVGEKITKQESLLRCQDGNEFIFALDNETDLDGNVEWNPARWINHSCAPNSEPRLLEGQVWIVATRAIPSGEEITFNYGYDLDSYREHPCHCGSPSCVGYIVAEEFFPLLNSNASLAALRRAAPPPAAQ